LASKEFNLKILGVISGEEENYRNVNSVVSNGKNNEIYFAHRIHQQAVSI
jgi:hypothetical protein